jgi:hypothetical protein
VNIKQKIATLAVGVALVGGGSAIALATSATSSAATGSTGSTATSTPANPQAGAGGTAAAGRKGRAGGLLRRVVHGDLTVRGKQGFQNVTYDRGMVTAKGDASFTITRPDKVTVTIKVSDTTRYRGIQSFDQLQVNKPAIVLSQGGNAVMVGQRVGGGAQATPSATPSAIGA